MRFLPVSRKASPLFLFYSLLLFAVPLLAASNGNCNCNYYANTQGTSACHKSCNPPSPEAWWESPVRKATTVLYLAASAVDVYSSVDHHLSRKRETKQNGYSQEKSKGKEEGGGVADTLVGVYKGYQAVKAVMDLF